jgi:hypothetical protein
LAAGDSCAQAGRKSFSKSNSVSGGSLIVMVFAKMQISRQRIQHPQHGVFAAGLQARKGGAMNFDLGPGAVCGGAILMKSDASYVLF